MKSASQIFTKEEITNIETTIAEVEKQTSGEVVPVIATSSGRYDRAEDLFGFLLSLVVLGISWMWFQDINTSINTWTHNSVFNLNLFTMITILIISFFIGMGLASHFPLLRLPLISTQEMQEEVEGSARETFQRLKIRNTNNAAGILIYVSLYEHRVHIIGDDTISAKLSQSDWQAVCDTIISGFKNNTPAQGLHDGILTCGELLSLHFPITPDDKNELANTLHFID